MKRILHLIPITRGALALNYRRFSSGWRSFAVDVLFPRRFEDWPSASRASE